MAKTGLDIDAAKQLLQETEGILAEAIRLAGIKFPEQADQGGDEKTERIYPGK